MTVESIGSEAQALKATDAKDASQLRQKRMIASHYKRLATAREDGRRVVYTFVPGNLTELLGALDLLPVLPEINALQSGMRGKSTGYIAEAEKAGIWTIQAGILPENAASLANGSPLFISAAHYSPLLVLCD